MLFNHENHVQCIVLLALSGEIQKRSANPPTRISTVFLVTRATAQLLYKRFTPGDPIPPSHFTPISDLQSLPLLKIFPFWMESIESNHHFPRRQMGPFFVIPHWDYSLESTPQPRRCCHHTPQLASAEYIESKW